jgi:hypothetical protein
MTGGRQGQDGVPAALGLGDGPHHAPLARLQVHLAHEEPEAASNLEPELGEHEPDGLAEGPALNCKGLAAGLGRRSLAGRHRKSLYNIEPVVVESFHKELFSGAYPGGRFVPGSNVQSRSAPGTRLRKNERGSRAVCPNWRRGAPGTLAQPARLKLEE